MLFNRFSIVPELSSAARIPLPGATSFLATDSKFSVFIIAFASLKEILVSFLAKSVQKCKRKPGAVAPKAFGAVSAENAGRAMACAEDSAHYNAPERQD